MQDDTPSRTALATAFLRALHLAVDDPPPILADTLAASLLPRAEQRFLARLGALSGAWRATFRRRRSAMTAIRAQVVVRGRYAEDAVAAAEARGACRYVVLGAGLDTYAFRSRSTLPVLELDHPATQRFKLGVLASRDIERPPDLTLVPVDFERQQLADAWLDAPGPELISWLGVTYYLTEAALTRTLATLAERTRPGTRLVLDYWREPPISDPSAWLLWGTRIAVATQQEPMRSFYEPARIVALARRCGWQVAAQLDAAEQNRRYTLGRRDGLEVPSFAGLLELGR